MEVTIGIPPKWSYSHKKPEVVVHNQGRALLFRSCHNDICSLLLEFACLSAVLIHTLFLLWALVWPRSAVLWVNGGICMVPTMCVTTLHDDVKCPTSSSQQTQWNKCSRSCRATQQWWGLELGTRGWLIHGSFFSSSGSNHFQTYGHQG